MLIDLDYREIEVPGLAGAKVQVRPLSVEAYQACLRVVSRTIGQDGKGAITLTMDAEALSVAKAVLPTHVSNLTGIMVRDKGEVRAAIVDDLTAHAPLFGACLAIIAHLISISTIQESDTGNSSGPSGSSPKQGSAGTAVSG